MLNQSVNLFDKNQYTSCDTSVNNIVNKVRCYQPFSLKGLDYIARLYNWYGDCHPSQTAIALSMGARRETANKHIKQWRQDGIVSVVGRYRDTCLYSPGPIFTDHKLREELKSFIPSLKDFPVFKLFITGLAHTKYIYTKQNKTSSVAFDCRPMYSKSQMYEKACFDSIEVDVSKMAAHVKGIEAAYKKQESKMIVPDYIKAIPGMTLSHQEQVELAVYPESIIAHALKKTAAVQGLVNKTAYFKKICKLESESRSSSFSGKQPQPNGKATAISNQDRTRSSREFSIKMEEHRQMVKESWRKPLTELGEIKAQGLARVKDPGLRMVLGQLFDQCVHSSLKEESDNPSVETREQFFHIPEPEQQDIFLDEDSGYESINTHTLFDDA